MAQAWSTWLPDVQPHVPGCPVPLIEHEVKRAAQAFFAGSRAWRAESAAMPVAAGQSTVTMTAPVVDAEVVRVETVWLDGRKLESTTVRTLDDAFGDTWADRVGATEAAVLLTPGVLRLYPIPAAAAVSGVTATLSLQPAETATGLADDLAVAYRAAITAGARARILALPGKGWTNLDLALVYGQAFASMVDAANVLSSARGNSRARRSARVSWC